MERKETIIMVVLQCSDDIANAKALRMALDADVTGKRTLGRYGQDAKT